MLLAVVLPSLIAICARAPNAHSATTEKKIRFVILDLKVALATMTACVWPIAFFAITAASAINVSVEINVSAIFDRASSLLLAAEVGADIADNATFAHTLPSAQQWYPNAFDACLNALAWAQLGDSRRAVRELNNLIDAQWADGLLPTTVFDPRHDTEYPRASDWRANVSEHRSRARQTSAIPHAPMIAQVLRFALNRINVSDELSELARSRGYDAARAFHEWLARELNASSVADGCLWLVHPWSSNAVASPLFDAALGAFDIGSFQHMLPKFKRTTLEATDGLSSSTYDRIVVLMVCGEFHEWDAALMAQYCPLRIVDPFFMSLAARDAQALADVAQRLGKRDDAQRFGQLAGRYVACLQNKLWDEQLGAFVALDVKFFSTSRVLTSIGLLPLIAPLNDARIVRRALDTLRSARMCGTAVGAQAQSCFPAPTVAFDESGVFARALPWRGAASPVVMWLLMQGAFEHNATTEGVWLRNAMLELATVNPSNWAQFFDPVNGVALGLANFSGTAAVLIDTIASDDSLRARLRKATPAPFEVSQGGGWGLFAVGLVVLLSILLLALFVRWRRRKLRARLLGVVEDIEHATTAGGVASGNVELEEENDEENQRRQ